MAIILCSIFLLIIYLLLDDKKYKKYGVLISFALIFVLFAFRNAPVGVDDNNYKLYFELIKSGDYRNFFLISNVEYSYFVICKFLSFLNFNYKSVFVFYSVIAFYFLWLTLKKFDLNKNDYLIVFLSFLSFSLFPFITVMRQFTAAAIGIYVMCDKKINIKNILLLIIAVLFHNSAIIFIPLFFIQRINFLNKKVVYLSIPLVSVLINYTGIFYNLLKILLRNTEYYNYVLLANETHFGGTGIVVIFMFIIYLFNLIFLKNDFNNKNVRFILFMQMLFFSLYFLCSGLGAMGRIYYYFVLFEPLSLVLINKNINNNNLYLVCCVAFLLFLNVHHIMIDVDRFSILNYSINFWR